MSGESLELGSTFFMQWTKVASVDGIGFLLM